MPDQVDEQVKQRRLDELMTLQQGISLEENTARVGESVREVLCEGEEDGAFVGPLHPRSVEMHFWRHPLHRRAKRRPGEFLSISERRDHPARTPTTFFGRNAMNLPNKLTILRACMIPVFVCWPCKRPSGRS